jgi:ferredoxin
MRLTVDLERCTGHGRCYELAPEVFAADDDDGHSILLVTGELPAEHEAAARRAVLNCPERAIDLVADG